MTPRERILRALSHREADRVPIDFGSTRSTGINVSAYRALREHLALPSELPRVFDVKQALAQPSEDMLCALGSDARAVERLSPSAGVRLDAWHQGKWDDDQPALLPDNYHPRLQSDGSQAIVDANGRSLLVKPKGGLYFDDVSQPLREAGPEEVDAYPYPSLSSEDLAFSVRSARRLTEGDYARVYSTGMSFFERGIKDFGFEEFMVRMLTEEALVERYLTHLLDSYCEMLTRLSEGLGGMVDVLQFNDDLGTQQSLMMAPPIYRKLFWPKHRALFEHAHRAFPQARVLLHSCGSIYPLIGDLIEAGVDALNPVQTTAAQMEPARLKRTFGRDITFWGGGCSTQTTLTFGSVDQVREEAERMIDLFAPGGGFVFNQVHNIQAGVDPAKVAALYDTAQSYLPAGGLMGEEEQA